MTNDKHLRIAVDLTPMLPGGENGGVKFAILESLKGLKEHWSESFQFLFLTTDDTHKEVQKLAVADDVAMCVLHRVKAKGIRALIEYRRAKNRFAELRHQKVDVFYAPFGLSSVAFPGIPRVTMVVDLLHVDYPWSLSAQTREWRRLQFHKLLRVTDLFQVVSEFTAKRLQAAYQISPEQIFITSHAVHHRLQPSISPYGLRQPFFFYPANFWVHKNHEILLLAYQLYLARIPVKTSWDLVLTGHLDERGRYLEKVANNLGIANRVRFLGFVPEERLRELYMTASCIVFPSLYEGFGIPIVEAMSFGLPIICGRDGSIPEVAGEAALFTDPRNPDRLASDLTRITKDEALRKVLVQRGTIQLQKFDFLADLKRLAAALATVSRTKASAHQIPRRDILRDLSLYYGRTIARKAFGKLVQTQPQKTSD